jgi:DNA primase
MIAQETIDRIFEAARIEEVVGDFVDLKKAGVNYKGRCPFHDEKTPSFVVSPTKGIYKCFGCGKGGNSIAFIQDLQSANYPEALRHIAAKYNIEIVEEDLTPEQESKLSEKESQFIATKFASEYFQNILWDTEEGKAVGLAYFKERGFSDIIIKQFNLGYSPKKQGSFEKYALKAGYDKNVLIEASLIGKSEDGRFYDKFRERIIFPIHSYSGKVIGFGGRAFNSDAKSKYLNSAESLIYDKSKVLYGLNISKQVIRKVNNCFIVEGYTDVIAMHQNGVKNVVSASGTALGTHQIRLIKRSTNNIVLLFDGDNAGVKATIRSINLCLKEEMNVKITSFPKGEDPDSYSKKLTNNEFQEYLEKKAVNFVDYLINIYKLKDEVDPAKIIAIKKKIILSISEMPDVFSREEYCKIYHVKLDVSEQSLLQQVNKERSKLKSDKTRTSVAKKPLLISQKKSISTAEKKLQKQEEEVLRILVNYGNEIFITQGEEESVAGMIINELHHDKITFSDFQSQKIYTVILDQIESAGLIDVKKLINHTNSEISKQTVDLIAQAHNISKNWQQKHNIITGRENEKLQKTTEKAILSLKKGIVDFKISKLQQQLQSEIFNESGLKKLNDLTKLKTQIAKLLGRNVG